MNTSDSTTEAMRERLRSLIPAGKKDGPTQGVNHIAVFAKGMANGYPMAAVLGTSTVMESALAADATSTRQRSDVVLKRTIPPRTVPERARGYGDDSLAESAASSRLEPGLASRGDRPCLRNAV